MYTLTLALVLAIRCSHQQATQQLLHIAYNKLDEPSSKPFMKRLSSLLTNTEKEWMSTVFL